ncbi:endonuclease domain-containing protein [Pseudolabrys sp. FHR47]|uniref:endonuclease domain-containing protein n=1 Tax=Pseudolabrys sp. FHR47 TaxID=2562284 RepID=UPI00351A9AB3
MWRLLRDRRLIGVKFRRQAPVEGYILDFVFFDRKIVIEIDGSHHFQSSRDEERDRILRELGFQVVRYWNNEVLQTPNAVLEDIFARLANGKD